MIYLAIVLIITLIATLVIDAPKVQQSEEHESTKEDTRKEVKVLFTYPREDVVQRLQTHKEQTPFFARYKHVAHSHNSDLHPPPRTTYTKKDIQAWIQNANEVNSIRTKLRASEAH